ncbi:uncharacterized protein LTR77_009242 [Saxophila tyrrhenica]|uniref:SprT-like domain-containing protein n=1 Tax=Saxophila tyrrhenica TaxID=1690608 RepID=A0AAV9NYN8_9PEZI|nr:hypothetical protein LTR77_009242 [Saxophila tyrrhenica]
MPPTNGEAALAAITTLADPSKEQKAAQSSIESLLASSDPFLDIHEVFKHYNTLYFRSLLLPRVEVSWSSRLTLCAGICELMQDPSNGNKYTRIRLKLSEPLLKFRPRSDMINTLLHESIHAYFFITTSWRHSRGDDGTGHGAGFLLLADAINSHGGYEVTVFHTFHDEVDSYRTHVWQCNGPCQTQAPFFGMVKRSMNRAPGKNDSWWQRHQQECGGTFTKVAEPEMSKAQVEKMSGLQRAGRQKNKIDGWVGSGQSVQPSQEKSEAIQPTKRTNTDSEAATTQPVKKKAKLEVVSCPICDEKLDSDTINDHLDLQHPP